MKSLNFCLSASGVLNASTLLTSDIWNLAILNHYSGNELTGTQELLLQFKAFNIIRRTNINVIATTVTRHYCHNGRTCLSNLSH